MPNDLSSRIARLEAQQERQDMIISESIQERRRQSDRTFEMLEEINRKIHRMQGFTAGMATVFGFIGAAASFLWDRLVNH